MRALALLAALGIVLIGPALPGTAAHAADTEPIEVSFDQTEVVVVIGQQFSLQSEVVNTGPIPAGARLAHLNVASLTGGVYVDPEDWSANRSLSVEPMAPGDSVPLDWDLHAVNAGSFDVYVVLLPNAAATAGTGPLIVSPPVHVTVTERRTLNPGGSLPTVIAVPVLLGLIAATIRYRGRRPARRDVF
ncbi:hypothetical protein Rhe02_16470 [Rhizocola hellebori]|uniref:DUF916 domain-containing protein n=1 Tax=Rhizocola hellebori TaxID=1392758 RepID=A0A8J3VEI3_9ACTN|nr:hypothetical protein [Rhizocola hellebori]GIH03580.1 hypothetical protein Rhe02_16470 [Rhizocola hellebori]